MSDADGNDPTDVALPPEDQADLEASIKEGIEKFDKTGDYSWLMGLKAMGVPAEGVESAIALGAQLVKQGMDDKALDYFAGLQQMEPANYQVYQWLGYLYARKRDYVSAYKMFLSGTAFNIEDPVLRLSLGEAMLMIDNDPTNGIAQIEQGLILAGKNPKFTAHVKRGEQLLEAVKERASQKG